MTVPLNLTNKTFGRLTVLHRVQNDRHGKTRWMCNCTCGNNCEVGSRELQSGDCRSCGCFQVESTVERSTKHGKRYISEYKVWLGMRQRCTNPNDTSYPEYGGRGIKICYRWLESFENFYDDMGTRPSKKHSLNRINNDGHYEPDNCEWATDKTQANNKRNTKKLEYNGSLVPIQILCERFKISKATLQARLKLGWNLQEALTKPLRIKRI